MASNEKCDKKTLEEMMDAYFPEIDFNSPNREMILEIVDELLEQLEEEKRKKKEEEKKK